AKRHPYEQLSSCALCQDVLRDPVSTSYGHWFCRQCLTSYWDQSTSSGESSCPQCGERSKIRGGLQISSKCSTVISKTEVIVSKNKTKQLVFSLIYS
uniref:RING-type domain-containing protein n=1 Tax=Labrus bergylta TaxID=56723 RepID=A0A3Q3EX92_9LABR